MTDLVKQQVGNDNELDLSSIDRDGLRSRIKDSAPHVLAFVGKRAAQEFFDRKQIEYGRQPESLGNTAIFVLPSPSGAARGFWDVSYWQDLAKFVGASR